MYVKGHVQCQTNVPKYTDSNKMLDPFEREQQNQTCTQRGGLVTPRLRPVLKELDLSNILRNVVKNLLTFRTSL